MFDGHIELIGLACWAAILIAFCTLRRPAMFAVVAAGLIAAFVYVAATAAAQARAVVGVTSAGLIAWSLGLSLVRAMLARSVSLKLLLASVDGGRADFDESIASRLDEAVAYRLVTVEGDVYQLAPLGRIVSATARAAYRVTRTNA